MRMIACIGWGSLIWDPRELPIAADWKTDGPLLPIEFTRQSQDGRLTLVLTPNAPAVPALWAPLAVADINVAAEALRVREGRTKRQWIGKWSVALSSTGRVNRLMSEWAVTRNLEGIVWTAIPPKFNGQDFRAPTAREAVEYLNSLNGAKRFNAEEYIRRTPHQVRTSYREVIERELGWLPR